MRLIIILLLSLSLTSQVSRACDDVVLKACDNALQLAQKLITDQQVQLNNYGQQSALQNQIIADQKKELDSPLHDPVKVAAATTVLIIVLELVTHHLQ